MEKQALYPPLADFCAALPETFGGIPEDRREILRKLGDFISEKRRLGQPARITVICTHNSRRSHMGQLWLLAAAAWYGVGGVETYSGGTEATAFNPRAVAAMNRAGFRVEPLEAGPNPRYEARYGPASTPQLLLSKTYDDEGNPRRDFAAVMVCSEADAACPFVPGAAARFSLPFEDPKNYDDTPAETARYDEACRLIARDLFFAMAHAGHQLKV